MSIFSLIGSGFHNLLYVPIINLLVVFYFSLNFFHIPYALGFAIILLTIVIRLVLYPLTASQLKASKKMQEISPHLSRLKEKHKNDAKMLQAETMKLYKEFGVNPAAGCLPILIQLPLIWALYGVLQDTVRFSTNQINNVLYSDALRLHKNWDTSFFGLPLAQHPSQIFNLSNPISWSILMVPILTGVFQFIQSKMMFTAAPKKEDKKVEVSGKKNDDFASAFQSQSLYIFPIMIGFFSFNFPIGLSLYWNTFTVFGIIQQYKISGLGGLSDWKEKIWLKR